MAIMYPSNIAEYNPTESERMVYNALRDQLPDSYEVFYSVEWSRHKNGKMEKSEADFIVAHPTYGFLCLEVKGGARLYVQDNVWYLDDLKYGPRKLHRSPYKQAEESMYYFVDLYSREANINYNGIYAAGVVFPFFNINNLDIQLSDRESACTIDAPQMDNLEKSIKEMFRAWGGKKYGLNMYSKSEHDTLMELIRKRIAVSAAAGALVKYKESQLAVINRVQDDYIYFLSNYPQFYIRGGAGTGKTWIAIKMANMEAKRGNRTLITCVSKPLSKMIQDNVNSGVIVKDIDSLLTEVIDGYEPPYANVKEGLLDHLKDNVTKYDAIFVDEAQDLNEEVACVLKCLLSDEKKSNLGVFYDDVQKLKSETFGDAFMIDAPPFLLRENIRNTSNIYEYAMKNTNLGMDVIRNPVEGPHPEAEKIRDRKHLTQRIENLLKEFIIDEGLSNKSIVILFERMEDASDYIREGIAQWRFVEHIPEKENEVYVSSAFDFKGLESDMVIYVHHIDSGENINYIAYTRAKFYLYELVLK